MKYRTTIAFALMICCGAAMAQTTPPDVDYTVLGNALKADLTPIIAAVLTPAISLWAVFKGPGVFKMIVNKFVKG